jgi:CheY-like chemotaxis protein
LREEDAMTDVLVIDDDGDCREAVRFALTREGYTVECAESGARALQLMRTHTPMLILCDVRMPEMSGPELVNDAVNEGLINPHHVVMVSAIAERCGSAASWCLTKPIDFDLMLCVVADFCGAR